MANFIVGAGVNVTLFTVIIGQAGATIDAGRRTILRDFVRVTTLSTFDHSRLSRPHDVLTGVGFVVALVTTVKRQATTERHATISLVMSTGQPDLFSFCHHFLQQIGNVLRGGLKFLQRHF